MDEFQKLLEREKVNLERFVRFKVNIQADADDILQQKRVAEAELAVAQAALQRIDAEIRSAKANLEYANTMFQRSEKLLSSNAESRSTYDKNRQNMLVAAAALESGFSHS